jgi:hypothetical protein
MHRSLEDFYPVERAGGQAHHGAILEQVRSGTMPCDSRWPPEQVATLERWIAGGSLP